MKKRYSAIYKETHYKDDIVIVANNLKEAEELANKSMDNGLFDYDVSTEEIRVLKFNDKYDEDRVIFISKEEVLGGAKGNKCNNKKDIQRISDILK